MSLDLRVPPILETQRLRLTPLAPEDTRDIFPLKRAEVGFMLSREAWGQGYALEAMRAVLSYAGAQGLRRLLARTHLGNRRSDSLLEELGFEEEGLLRGHVLRDGERRDCRLFGLLLYAAAGVRMEPRNTRNRRTRRR